LRRVLGIVEGRGKRQDKGLMRIDCGLTHITDDEIKESLKKSVSGPEEAKEVDGVVFGAIAE
jgi:hypothetical protein